MDRARSSPPSDSTAPSNRAPIALLPDRVLLPLPMALTPSLYLTHRLAYCLPAARSTHLPRPLSPPSMSHLLSLPSVHRDSPTAHPAAPGTSSAIAPRALRLRKTPLAGSGILLALSPRPTPGAASALLGVR